MKKSTRNLTLGAMFAALAYVVMLICRLPITSLDFLTYDPKDVILVMCGFTLGPSMGAVVALIVAFLEMISASASGVIGFLMNFVAAAAFVLPASLFYKRARRLESAIIGLVVSTLCMTACMLIWNHFVTPFYMGTPQDVVDSLLLPVFLPFNLVKGSINTALTLFLYKPLSKVLHRANLLPKDAGGTVPAKKSVLFSYILAGALIVASVVAILVMKGVL